MSSRWRVLLASLGVALVCISCAALAYAVWPLSSVREQMELWSNMFRMP